MHSTQLLLATRTRKKKANVVFEVRQDDIFPLADDKHNYWSGYFTSRPALKRQVRFATNFLASARQLEIVSNTTAAEVNLPTQKKSPPVGTSWTDSLEGTTGVATHHDGMSGTERQDVSDDYEQRMSESSFEVEAGVALSLAKIFDLDPANVHHCNCNAGGNCLNMSVCAATSYKDLSFNIMAWNPNGGAIEDIVRIPVVGTEWAVTGPDGSNVTSQLIPLDDRTKELPLLYLNSYGMNSAQIAAEKARLSNNATHVLVFSISVPAVGGAVYTAKSSAVDPSAVVAAQPETDVRTVENDMYALTFENGELTQITNKVSKASVPMRIVWGWYNSSVGGCTQYPADVPKDIQEPPCTGQKSGAYIFRPNSSELFPPGQTQAPTLSVVQGPVVTEVYQKYSDWVSHVIRLYKGADYIEVEWTAGPIPVDTPWMAPVAHTKKGEPMPNIWGKEVVVRYQSGLASQGTWYTDSNGKEMVKRVYNKRGPSYPHTYNISEPVAGNYYPVNAMMSLDDGTHELAVLTDVSQAGASLADGGLEFMVHRRVQDDDSRGVQEPLNETMCGCNDIGAKPGSMGAHGHEGDGGCDCAGLTMRGKHWLVFDTISKAHEIRRVRSEGINFPSTLAFHHSSSAPAVTTFSALSSALPPNVKLVTLTSNYASFNDGKFMLRLSHLYEAGEHPTLAVPVAVDLEKVFGKAGLKITSAVETTLTGNRPLAEVDANKFRWKTRAPNQAVEALMAESTAKAFEERIAFNYPVVTIRPMEVRTFMASFE
jgi:alpha-mannosidase